MRSRIQKEVEEAQMNIEKAKELRA